MNLNPKAAQFVPSQIRHGSSPGAGPGGSASGGKKAGGMAGIIASLGLSSPVCVSPSTPQGLEDKQLNWYRLTLAILEVIPQALRLLFLRRWNALFQFPANSPWNSSHGASMSKNFSSSLGKPGSPLPQNQMRYLNQLAGPLDDMDISALRVFLVGSRILDTKKKSTYLKLVDFFSDLGQAIGGRPDGISELRNSIAHSTIARMDENEYNEKIFKLRAFLKYLKIHKYISTQEATSLLNEMSACEAQTAYTEEEYEEMKTEAADLRSELEVERAAREKAEQEKKGAEAQAALEAAKAEASKERMEEAEEKLQAAIRLINEAGAALDAKQREAQKMKLGRDLERAARLAEARRQRIREMANDMRLSQIESNQNVLLDTMRGLPDQVKHQLEEKKKDDILGGDDWEMWKRNYQLFPPNLPEPIVDALELSACDDPALFVPPKWILERAQDALRARGVRALLLLGLPGQGKTHALCSLAKWLRQDKASGGQKICVS